MTRVLLAVGVVLALQTGAHAADDRAAIFVQSTKRIASLGTLIEQAQACGLSSPDWGLRSEVLVTQAMTLVAARLWPKLHEDAAEYAAIARGKHPTPGTCDEIASSGEPAGLDDMLKGK